MLYLLLLACGPGHKAFLSPSGQLAVAETSLDFGAVAYGDLATLNLTLVNTGSAQLTVGAVTDNTLFGVSQPSFQIGAGAELALAVSFQPAANRDAAAGTLTLTAEGAEVAVALTGSTDPDGDDDGAEHSALGGDDCDDSDPASYPGADEVWYDGVDQDCAGGDDYDADEDGVTGEDYGGADCDDSDPASYPGADEIWYDGVDQDCAGDSDYDADDDGYDAEGYDGSTGDPLDCDDSDDEVNPDAVEVWYDGVDQDCSDTSDYDADDDGYDAEGYDGASGPLYDCDDADDTTWDGASELNDGADNDCDALIDEDFVSRGDMVITEIMIDPASASSQRGQHFEVINVSSGDIELDGWQIAGSAGAASLEGGAIAAGAYGVICANDDPVNNGDVACDATWNEGLLLDEDADELVLSLGAIDSDEVAWGPPWPIVNGASVSLDPGAIDEDENDDVANWCTSTTEVSSTHYGTPGEANPPCE